jgi:hypothetical protein
VPSPAPGSPPSRARSPSSGGRTATTSRSARASAARSPTQSGPCRRFRPAGRPSRQGRCPHHAAQQHARSCVSKTPSGALPTASPPGKEPHPPAQCRKPSRKTASGMLDLGPRAPSGKTATGRRRRRTSRRRVTRYTRTVTCRTRRPPRQPRARSPPPSRSLPRRPPAPLQSQRRLQPSRRCRRRRLHRRSLPRRHRLRPRRLHRRIQRRPRRLLTPCLLPHRRPDVHRIASRQGTRASRARGGVRGPPALGSASIVSA